MNIHKTVRDLKVAGNHPLNSRNFILELQIPEPMPLMLPGQFTEVLVEDSPATFLRRPFSIHQADYHRCVISLLIQIKGEGTRHLSRLNTGDTVNVIYPLGNSFTLPTTKNVLLVGGGCGIAPLLFLAQFLHQNSIRPVILLGFRSKEEVVETEDFSRYGQVLLTTEDGSEGEKGLVTDHPIFQQPHFPAEKIYACGPGAMLKAIAGLAEKHRVDCEVSLENMMACGFGVCLCCVTATDRGNERVCKEGPVFNIKRLRWILPPGSLKGE